MNAEVENKLIVSSSPHIKGTDSTRKIMILVCLALSPTLLASLFLFGWRVLLVVGISVLSCVGFEWLYCFAMKKPSGINDFSAVVTGLILAFNVPASLPLWMLPIGSFVAIVVVKQLFGGLGYNIANPALVGRIVLQISFAAAMVTYTFPSRTFSGADALATATPMATNLAQPPLLDLLLGTHGGVLGETCSITLILGGILLLATKVIGPAIPFTYIGATFAFKFFLTVGAGATGGSAAVESLAYVLSGGLLLNAFFMATDYVTSPYTKWGKIAFGIGLAVITVLIREWSRMDEGASYALLIMNLLVPYINVLFRRLPLGVIFRKAKKAVRKGVD